MTESDRPPHPGAAGPGSPDTPGRAERDARVRSQERLYMRRGMIFVIVSSLLFVFGVWGLQKMISERGPAGPAGPRDVTHAVRSLYNAAYADGIRMFESEDPRALARWLTQRVGRHASLPDLRPAGLVPSGVRQLNVGKGWGMIQYRDRAGPRGDVLAVIAPPDAVRVGEGAVARQALGRSVWVLADGRLSFAWLEARGADWVLVSARDEDGIMAAARAAIAAP